MKDLRRFIKNTLRENLDNHRCLGGNVVPIESAECYDDVCLRIDDAVSSRDEYPLGTDAREHYNGLLKVLRRKQRRSKKFVDKEHI
tara:strand:+ start:452 stop:709 length:258 start_codon:yes stop_codon:yes gene_type:complete